MIKRALGCLLFTLVPALVGLYLGMQFADQKITGVFNPWTPVPLPGDTQAASFVEGVGSIVYLRSVDGRLFLQELEEYRHAPVWRQVEAIIPEEELDRRIAFGECTPVEVGPHPRFGVEPPSSSVAQLNCFHSVNPEHTVSMVFVILENGDVQRWMRDDPGLGALGIYLIYMGLGAILGAGVGLLLYGSLVLVRGRGEKERALYQGGVVVRRVPRDGPTDPTSDWLDRIDDDA